MSKDVAARWMIEMSELDIRVVRSSLGMLLDLDGGDLDQFIVRVQKATPAVEPDEVASSALLSIMVARDLHGYLEEVLAEIAKDEANGD